ncbi:unnamed protein product [Chondrus crispus]|uniref:Proteasome activator complex subunit 4 C-terminal domain-containing protein n=1 Tax=Chondrus crispus TaxID=2769 RepID=R7QDZ9_CHOCR|nr:unnamed protein product [Chondrus crispus]CDF36742.1 unnamed protein product [Chondrus crispus]|eukprot:XP_005716561.1 unnamed protein product [Chondrus crispus]
MVPAAAGFIVHSMDPKNDVSWDFFERLIALIANYFHPSNTGRWSVTTCSFLVHTIAHFVSRVTNERRAEKAGLSERIFGSKTQSAVAAAEHRLSRDFVNRVVNLLLPLMQQALHSKYGSVSVQAAGAARDLAILSPEIVIEPCLVQAAEGLQSISSPHRTSAALRLLSSLTPVFMDPSFFPNGVDFLPQILMLTLPGIDANDLSKTDATFKFIASAAGRLQSIIASDPGCAVAHFLEDYVFQLLERVFALLESLEAPPKKNRNGHFPSGGGSPVSFFIFSVSMENLLGALPRDLTVTVAQRISKQVRGAAVSNAIKFYALLVRTAAAAAAEAKSGCSANIFIPQLLDLILEKSSDSTDEQYTLTSVGENELVWRIRMLAQASRTCGRMLQFKEKISTVIRLAMDKPSRPIYKAGGRLLRGFLEGLSCTRMKFGPGLGTEEDAVTDGGIYSFQWKEPSKEEWAGAEDFVEYFLKQAEKLCYEGSKGLKEPEVTNDRDVLFRALRMLHAIQRGGRWIFAGAIPDRLKELDRFADAAISMSKQDAKMILKRPVSAGLGGERVESGGREIATKLWSRTYLLVSEIMAMVIATRPDDGALLYRTLEPLELAHEPFRKASPTRQPLHICTAYKSIYTSVVASKRPFGAEGGPGRDMPRFIVKLRVEAHHELRLSIAARGGLTADSLNDTLISQVAGLAINDFPRVRGEARGVLTRAMRFAKPAVRRREIQRIIAVLKESAISVTASSGLASELGDITSPSSTRGVAMQSEDPHKPGEMPSTTTQRLAQSASGAKNGDILYDRMIGAAAVLRSAAAAPIIMRSWDLFISILKALLDAMLSAERADAASAVSYLFSKLASLVRPLSLTPIRVVREDFSATADETYTAPERDEEKRRTMLYDDLNKYLLGVLNRTTESLKKDKEQEQSHGAGSELSKTKEAHWRLQSLVATILYIILREDRPPPASVAEFFIKGMASDVVTLRQISSKAIMFILAVHGRRDGVKRTEDASFDDSPTSWRTAGNLALGAIGEVVCEPQFAKKLVHTLALDHDDSEGGSRRNQMIGNAGGAIAVMNISRNIDGDACWMMAGGRPWPSSWVPRSRDNMNIVRMRLYESFVRVFGRYIFDALAPTLSDLIAKLEAKQEIIISGVKPEDVRVLAAEMLAGICRGLDIYHCEDGVPEEKLQSLAFALLSDMTGRLGNVTGGTLIRLIATSESHTVGCGVWASILEWLLKKKPVVVPMGDGPVAHLQARRLRYLHACVADIDESKGDITSRFVKETLGPLTSEIGFDHQLKTVREEVARCLSLIASIVPKQAEIFFDDKITELFGRMSPGAMTDVAGPDSSSIEDAQKKSRSRQGETLSRFISIVQWGGRTTAFEKYVPKALPALFASFDESDSERISHARMALSFCAQGRFLSSTIREVIVAVEETVNDPRWKVRSSVLAFLQVFSFVSLFRISPNAMQHIRQIVLTLLADSQLEVRQAAAAVFVTMVRDATTEAVEEVRNSRMKVLESTTPKRRGSKREPLDSETVRERHGAVLGLSSMITSNPYSVPQWMPAVLVALSSCVNDPPPISTGVRKLFADFMRTHRDEWSTHKLAFAPDELDIVSEVLVSPSYYA